MKDAKYIVSAKISNSNVPEEQLLEVKTVVQQFELKNEGLLGLMPKDRVKRRDSLEKAHYQIQVRYIVYCYVVSIVIGLGY